MQSVSNEVRDVFQELINSYLEPFSGGFKKEQLNKAEKEEQLYIGRYVVKSGKLYVRGAECRAISSLILCLLKSQELPDLDFLYLNSPAADREFSGPVFCQSRLSGLTTPIPFHDRTCSEGNVRKYAYNDWNLIFNTIITKQVLWEEKKNQLIWRGGGADAECQYQNIQQAPRGKLCHLSITFPDLIDAKFATQQGIPIVYCDDIYKGSFLSIKDQCHYKFQIILHGYAGTFPGARWRLLSGGVCFIVDSEMLDFWYLPLLEPYVHYIPISSSELESLPVLIEEFLTINKDQAERIAKNGFDFAYKYLSPDSLLLYCRMLLEKYAELYKGNVPDTKNFKLRENFNNEPLYF